MSKVKWTPAQTDAIEARSGSVLVSAAAGSGKTAVLVERVIRAVTDTENPVPLDRMLIVTFTRDATFEMRTRIDKALNKLLRKDPFNKHLLSQKQALYSAKICTIDSFCQDFVRQYFYKLNIRGDFRIADEGECSILMEQALDNTFDFYYSQSTKSFPDLVDATCSYRNDKNLREHILNVYKFLTSFPFMENWLKKAVSFYDVNEQPFEKSPFADYIFGYTADCIGYCIELADSASAYLAQDDVLEAKHIEKIRTVLTDDILRLEQAREFADNRVWDKVRELVNAKFPNFPTIKNCPENSQKDRIKAVREQYKKEFSKLSELYTLDLTQIASETRKTAPLIRQFADCLLYFRDELMRLKNEKNVLEFSDVEHMMINLLCENRDGEIVYTDISEEISSMFDLIMVDEFQDINEAQNLLFQAVSHGRNNLFVVGDVKQSIYSFRQAKPQIFIDYKDSLELYSRKDNNYPAKIILDRNFRSRSGITAACNFIFKILMSHKVGGIEYDNEEQLVCGAEYPESAAPSTELMLIDVTDLDKEKNETALDIEAKKIAEKIHSLIFEEKVMVRDGDSMRPITYGDIAVLLRSAKGYTMRAAAISDVLRMNAIPAFSDERRNFFEEKEIKIMLNMLRIIDNPVQDIPLLSVMMSPMFDFTADDIAKLRAENSRVPLYSAVKLSKEQKCVDFISFLSHLRTISVTTTVDRLVSVILNSTGFNSIAVAENGNAEGNLNLLRDYARDFASKSYKTLTAFITQIDRLTERNAKLNAGDSSESSSVNAVRVMSIHSSKGLEFPVCFLSCTSTKFNMGDTTEDLVCDSENGIGIRYRENLVKYDTVQRRVLSYMSADSKISEEMRILYVALTRAKERLIITSTQKEPLKYLESIESKITSYPPSPFVVRSMRCYSDWLFMCALQNPDCDIPRSRDLPPTGFSLKTDKWKFSLLNKYSQLTNTASDAKAPAEKRAEPSIEYTELLRRNLKMTYDSEPLSRIPQKFSASQLAHKDSDIFNRILRKPAFTNDDKPTGAERGTAFHLFMENCDFRLARENVKNEGKRLVEKGILTERQRDMLDYNKLSAFFDSTLVGRVLQSAEVYREFTFTVKISASDYNPGVEPDFADRELVMQGAVDLAFVEDGSVVLVDYKTDRVKDSEKLRELYSRQVELYKKALEETLELPVKEVIIYSIHLGEQLNV